MTLLTELGLPKAPWVLLLLFVGVAAGKVLKPGVFDWNARQRRRRRADLSDSYEKLKALGPVEESVLARLRHEMLLVAEGGPAFWSGTAGTTEEPEESEAPSTADDDDEHDMHESMAAFGVSDGLIAAHQIIGVVGVAVGWALTAVMIGFAFWVPWMLFDMGIEVLGVALSIIPLLLLKAGLSRLIRRFPKRLSVLAALGKAWDQRTAVIRRAYGSAKQVAVWHSGSILIVGMGIVMAANAGAAWPLVVALLIAALWSTKVHIEQLTFRRAAVVAASHGLDTD
ncbi:MAG: hypothetical protein ACRBN8_45760 [Nannocystales bacterium]